MITIMLWVAGGGLLCVLVLAVCGISVTALLNMVLARPVYLLYLRVRGPAYVEYYGLHRPEPHSDELLEWDEVPEAVSTDLP